MRCPSAKRLNRRLILRALLFEPRERAEAGGVAFSRFKEAAPCDGELQQADGVAGRRGVEDDVVVTGGDFGIGQQRGEFVEGGDFRRAGSRKLLLNALDDGFRQLAAHGADDAVAIGLRGGLRVDFKRKQARHGGNGGDLVADGDPEHLTDIRRRIGADEQHAASGFRELDRRRAGDRRFADAALAGEEEETRRAFEKFHIDLSAAGTAAAACALLRFVGFLDARPARQLGRGSDSDPQGQYRHRRGSAAAPPDRNAPESLSP